MKIGQELTELYFILLYIGKYAILTILPFSQEGPINLIPYPDCYFFVAVSKDTFIDHLTFNICPILSNKKDN